MIVKALFFSTLISISLHGLFILIPCGDRKVELRAFFSSKKSDVRVSFNTRIKRKRTKKNFQAQIGKTVRDSLDQAIVDSVVIKKTIPKYPWKSRIYREEGRVVVGVVIDSRGVAKEVKIIRSSGFKRLDLAALEAARQSEYQSATRNQVSVIGNLEIEFKFELTH